MQDAKANTLKQEDLKAQMEDFLKVRDCFWLRFVRASIEGRCSNVLLSALIRKLRFA